jgi:serine/threonine-protein kinase
MIGKILGNRYQVAEKIGDGGTAFVYKGLDNLLNRNVTIKVLRPEYVNDQDFVRRFRREAQAAASLSHPNIVSIYDVGYEDGIHYIVMEFIKGLSLKEQISEMGYLPVKMAVDYACQIAHALEHAHRHGIIHRDVKPHNILITDDGRVKVTDFGIAQAVTAATVTYNGAILGSVHYFSPEQASGGHTGEKSDLYSLGVVLYEMLTGRVPYNGDSPVSIAVKHIQEPFPDPMEVNEDIPVSVQQIISRAVEKDPDKRYLSAREMSEALSQWLSGVEPKNGYKKPAAHRDRRPGRKMEAGATKHGKRWTILLVILLVATAITIGVWQLRSFFIVPELEVPDVEGRSISDAAQLLDEAELKYRIADQMPDDQVPSGHVLRQTPSPGKRVKKNRIIDLVLSTGPVLVEVEDVVGKTELEATIILRGQDFDVDVNQAFSDEVPGTVIRQDPGKGFKYAKGSTVTLTVSKGGQPFQMLDLHALSLSDAKNWISLFGLKLRYVSEENSEELAAGFVISQSPAAGEMVQPGDLVDLVVSKGSDQQELQQREIRVNTSQIPAGELVMLTIIDAAGTRTEEYVSDGEVIVTMGWGNGVVEVRWLDRMESKTFP